ncbi:HNH endonuclease [Peptoniphilaceae bacterium SGI.137]
MAKPWAKAFYNSAAWRKARAAHIAKVYGLCEWCGEPGYIVDHIVELTPDNINNPNITLSDSNLQYLCHSCHNQKTFQKFSPTRSGLIFDSDGNLIEAPLKKF